MEFFSIFTCVGKLLHWLTGWIAHPDKGGCIEHSNPLDLVDPDNKLDKKQ